MTTIITFSNFKGGVGKSTSAVNLAALLAMAGNRTLLCDNDPQGNGSGMFVPERKGRPDLREVIWKRATVQEAVCSTRINGLDVLPATFGLAMLDKELVVTPNGVQRIEKALRPVVPDYDYIVFDTGPNLSHLTLGALAMSDWFIIPVTAAIWATDGLLQFLAWIEENRQDEVLSASLMGLLLTMVDDRTRIGRAVVEQLSTSDFPVFDAIIPRRIGAEDAVDAKLVAGEDGVDPDFSREYQSFTKQVIEIAASKKRGAHRA